MKRLFLCLLMQLSIVTAVFAGPPSPAPNPSSGALTSLPTAADQAIHATGNGTYEWTANPAYISITASLFNSTAANGSRVSLLPNNTVAYTVNAGETGFVNENNVIYQFLNGGTKYALLTTNSDANPVKEVDGHASGNLTAVQVQNTTIYNYGMGAADVALVLPTAAAGYSALFTVSTAQSNKWGVRAGTNDKIYLIAADGTVSAGSDNGYARMTAAQIGQSFACWTTKTDGSTWDWSCKAIAIGTSTFAAN